MKVSIHCKDGFLERTLELYLKDKICDDESADFIIADENFSSKKPVFLVGDNSPYLCVPFSKDELFEAIAIFWENMALNLQNEIDLIFDEFKEKILNLVEKYANNDK